MSIDGVALISTDITNADGTVTGAGIVAGPSGVPVPLNITASASVAATPKVSNLNLQITDPTFQTNYSAQPNTVIVGQQINLACQLSITNSFMTNFVLTDFQWTVPGYAISNYIVAADSSSAIVVTNFSTNKLNTQFYWVDGATNRIVQVSATVNGLPVAGQAVFNVVKPAAEMTALVTGEIREDDNYAIKGTWLHFGGYPDGNEIIPGILFTHTSGGAPFRLSQFQSWRTGVLHRELLTAGGTNNFIDSQGLDWLTQNNPEGDYPGMQPRLFDAGNNPISITHISANDHFVEYLMFKNDAQSIWVPVESITWNWSASASAPDWQPENPQKPDPKTNKNPTCPVWTNKTDAFDTTSHQP